MGRTSDVSILRYNEKSLVNGGSIELYITDYVSHLK